MTLTKITTLGNMNEFDFWENIPFAAFDSVKSSTPTRSGITRTIQRKKPKRCRVAFTTNQILALEKEFSIRPYITPMQRHEIATRLNLDEKNVRIWFQNRRMRQKRRNSLDSSSNSSKSETSSLTYSPSSSDLPNVSSLQLEGCNYQPNHYVRENHEELLQNSSQYLIHDNFQDYFKQVYPLEQQNAVGQQCQSETEPLYEYNGYDPYTVGYLNNHHNAILERQMPFPAQENCNACNYGYAPYYWGNTEFNQVAQFIDL